MIGLRKKLMQLIMVTLVACAFFSHARVFAAADTFTPYFTTLSDGLFGKGTPLTTDAIVSNYCNAVLNAPMFTQNNFIYDGKQSVFVHLLCRNISGNPASSSKSFAGTDVDKYFARKNFQQLGFEDLAGGDENGKKARNMCDLMSDECNLAKHIPNLFDDIMTDYVNIKQANLYGLIGKFDTDKDMEAQINIFSQANYGMDLCETEKKYTATCRAMKGYIKNARNLLSDVRILNSSGILTMVLPMADANAKIVRKEQDKALKEFAKIQTCTARDDTYNILLCGLYGDTATPMVSFVNLVYNEMYHYRLFAGYYFLSLQRNPGTLIKSSQNNDLSAIMKKFSSQYIRSKSALTLTFRMMRDTYLAFPFHIGFLMYQEDLDGFGELLAKITTPIYTLYDKLQRVQSK